MKKTSTIIISVIILIAALVVMKVLFDLKEDTPKQKPQVQTKLVETRVVTLQPVEAHVTAFGRATTAQPVALYAEAAGTLEEGDLPFKPSQKFKKGDLLVKIDDRQTRYELNSAKSDLLNALATVLPEIKVDFPDEYFKWQNYFDGCQFEQRLEELPENDNNKIRLYLSRFNVYKLYFTVRNLEIKLDKHFIYAPFNGSIVRTDSRVGSSARNGMVLGEIISLEEMEISVPLEVKNIAWIDMSRSVTISSNEFDVQWQGKVTRVGSSIDGKTQTVNMYISVNGDQSVQLLNNVFLELDIPGKSIEKSFSIPPKALYENKYVYLIEEGKLVRRDVTMVRREADQIIINSGLNDGDTLVIEVLQGVSPGMSAQPRNMKINERGL